MRGHLGTLLLPAVSIVAALGLWEIVSQTELLPQTQLPSMSTSFSALWTYLTTGGFWIALLQTIRGWAFGLGIAAGLENDLFGLALAVGFLGLAIHVVFTRMERWHRGWRPILRAGPSRSMR